MKKTLIALAVASSAILSGSAFAWESAGTGGNIDFSGTITPEVAQNPWEVKLSPVVDMGTITAKPGETGFAFKLSQDKGLLGIRTVLNTAFTGNTGITPQITINNTTDVASLDKGGAGVLTISLNATNAEGDKIGTFTFSPRVGAEASVTKDGVSSRHSLYASQAGDAFYGGLKTTTGVSSYPYQYAQKFDPEYVANYTDQGSSEQTLQKSKMAFNDTGATYSAFYYLGVDTNTAFKLNLDKPVSSDTVTWKASMPVTIAYQ
ncbi:fimbrial protein [Escherichia coli B12:H4]